MYVLGQLVAWLVIMAMLALAALIPALWAWLLWLRVQRARRPPRSAYDDAYVRALESVAAVNARRDALRDIAALL